MLRRLFSALLLVVPCLCPRAADGQEDSLSSRTHVGLAAVSALTLHGSYASIQRGYHGIAAGATVDFGHIASPRIRLLADVGYLRTFPKTEVVVAENRSLRDVFRDLSATIAFAFHPTAPTARLAPYVATGLGVHVLSSSFGSVIIDSRYNTNNFGLLAAAGARLRVGTDGRRALLIEVRRALSQDVSQTSIHLGMSALLGELAGH